jgi:ubiquinone/menaquinone biosynthesis C-methylase UbiE
VVLKRDLFEREKLHAILDHYGPTCVDVGAGDGSFAARLKQHGRSVEMFEVMRRPGGDPAVQCFDGRAIPRPDKSYDTAVCMFVLHHAADQAGLLRELGRVARRTVIIGEDVMETPLDRVLGALHLGTSPWGRAANAFRSDTEWRRCFTGLGWRLIEARSIPRQRAAFYPIARRVYVIEPT